MELLPGTKNDNQIELALSDGKYKKSSMKILKLNMENCEIKEEAK